MGHSLLPWCSHHPVESHKGNDGLAVEGGSRGSGVSTAQSYWILQESWSDAALQWLQWGIPQQGSMDWALTAQEALNQLEANCRRADTRWGPQRNVNVCACLSPKHEVPWFKCGGSRELMS